MRMRYGYDANNYVFLLERYALLRCFHPQNFFDIFQNLGADGKCPVVSWGLDTNCYVLCGLDTHRYGMNR